MRGLQFAFSAIILAGMVTPLRKARLAAGLKLSDVAIAVDASEASLSRIECGKQTASPEVAARLATFFDSLSEIEILYPERFTAGDEGRAA